MKIEVQAISKRFGATLALDSVDLTFNSGEIHTLVGENGAGKSTLGKILSGIHQPDSGRIVIDGEPVSFNSPRAALNAGITIIAQELALVPNQNVLNNIYLGLEETTGPFLNDKLTSKKLTELIAETGISVEESAIVATLRTGEQQKVEILRALARNAQVLVMDEPTARLSVEEVETLKKLIIKLRDRGHAIVFISHFLSDVLEISDKISIMRDGKLVRTSTPSMENHESLVEAMTGRSFGTTFPEKIFPAPGVQPILKVDQLSSTGVFQDISFQVFPGEILGIAGLVGSGRTELIRAIIGADKVTSGSIFLNGEKISNLHPADSIKRRIAFLPESRKDQGIIPDRAVSENITLPHLSFFTRLGLIRSKLEKKKVAEAINLTGVKAASQNVKISTLSGGNQQKSLFARSLATEPVLFFADEPTRGVDVGSKRAIYELLRDLAAKGLAIVVVSSELDEIVGLPHRVLVMRQGRVVRELSGDEIEEKAVLQAAFAEDR